MNFVSTAIPDVFIIEPRVFGDHRGFFMETYQKERFLAAGIDVEFVQDNHSRSSMGVLRGLHYQNPNAQGKLVRTLSGSIFDVALDVRKGSPTFGKWVGVELSAENKRQLWVPPGLAHGFGVISETAEVAYKCTTYYDPASEKGILWNDPDVGIAWPLSSPTLSEKDANAPRLRDAVNLPVYRGAIT